MMQTLQEHFLGIYHHLYTQGTPLGIVKLLQDKSTEVKSQTALLPQEILTGTKGMNADTNTTETGRLFFRRRAKQVPLQRNIFELSPRDLSLTPQM